MSKLRLGISASILGIALALSACGNNEPASVDTPATPDTPGAATDTPERPTKADILDGFDETLAQAQASEGPGAPAMWRLSDEDTTIYIFGTVHLLRPELEWRTEAFDEAISSADKIVFEVDMKSPEAQRAIATDFLQRGMYEDGRTLKMALNDADEAVISAAFDSIGVPFDAMNTFEPWMASVYMGAQKLTNAGFDPEAGVESIITVEATAAGKSFEFLETISQQADAFDLLPEEEQITMLYETALLLDESPRMLDLLVDEWAEGDVDGIATLVANPDGYGFTDAAYQSLLVKRNQAWVPQIEAMLEQPGSVFIAVGAGHLAGPDSVVRMLESKNYNISKYN